MCIYYRFNKACGNNDHRSARFPYEYEIKCNPEVLETDTEAMRRHNITKTHWKNITLQDEECQECSDSVVQKYKEHLERIDALVKGSWPPPKTSTIQFVFRRYTQHKICNDKKAMEDLLSRSRELLEGFMDFEQQDW